MNRKYGLFNMRMGLSLEQDFDPGIVLCEGEECIAVTHREALSFQIRDAFSREFYLLIENPEISVGIIISYLLRDFVYSVIKINSGGIINGRHYSMVGTDRIFYTYY